MTNNYINGTEQSIRFKFLFPTWEKYQKFFNDTIIKDIIDEEMYNFIYRKYANRKFKWSNSTQIVSRYEQHYHNMHFDFKKTDEIQQLTKEQLISKKQSRDNYVFDRTQKTDETTSIETFKDTGAVASQDEITFIELGKMLKDIPNAYDIVEKHLSPLFLPFIN